MKALIILSIISFITGDIHYNSSEKSCLKNNAVIENSSTESILESDTISITSIKLPTLIVRIAVGYGDGRDYDPITNPDGTKKKDGAIGQVTMHPASTIQFTRPTHASISAGGFGIANTRSDVRLTPDAMVNHGAFILSGSVSHVCTSPAKSHKVLVYTCNEYVTQFKLVGSTTNFEVYIPYMGVEEQDVVFHVE